MFVRAIKTLIQSVAASGLLVGLPQTLASAQLQTAAMRWVPLTVVYENANACMWSGVSPRICKAAYRSAFRQHVRVAPVYRELADCEQDFYPDECVSGGAPLLWTPWLSGFSLTTLMPMTPLSAHSHSYNPWPRGQVGTPVNGEQVDTSQAKYFSEPLYRERDGAGGSRLATLQEKLRDGEHFERAVSRHRDIKPGSALGDQRLARVFKPQRLMEAAPPGGNAEPLFNPLQHP